MPVVVRRRKKGEGGKRYKIVEVETGKVLAESDRARNAYTHARIRNIEFFKKRATLRNGQWGVWITTKRGKRVFVPLEKYAKSFGISPKALLPYLGKKIRSKGKGRGKGYGMGKGPIGIPIGMKK